MIMNKVSLKELKVNNTWISSSYMYMYLPKIASYHGAIKNLLTFEFNSDNVLKFLFQLSQICYDIQSLSITIGKVIISLKIHFGNPSFFI